ncbi:MAG: hypothetical protein AAB662_00240 [Patescibacteria group bacterium]
MDAKQQFGQLDPKLKEVYERVMGTSVASSPKASPVPPQQPVAPTPVAIPQPENPPPTGGRQMPQAPITPQPQSPTQAVSVKPHGHISSMVWILGGFTFVIIYALAWVKIFNLKLPFAP